MNATVIDTLRYANRLKEAGVEGRQAEVMALALNDQLTGEMATKTDLDHAIVALKGDIDRVETTLKADIAKLDAKFEARFEAMDSRFEAMDSKFEAMDSKFEARFQELDGKIGTQGRYVFLVLALTVALGLYNAVRPHFAGTAAASPAPDTPESEVQATPAAAPEMPEPAA